MTTRANIESLQHCNNSSQNIVIISIKFYLQSTKIFKNNVRLVSGGGREWHIIASKLLRPQWVEISHQTIRHKTADRTCGKCTDCRRDGC